MKTPQIPTIYLIGGGLALAAFVWASSKGAKATGETVGAAVVNLTDGVLSGVVTGTGALVGLPPTSLTKCEKAKAEGRTWDASFDCTAGDFLSYLWK